eukprot:3899098-Amphidinium_carterae.2
MSRHLSSLNPSTTASARYIHRPSACTLCTLSPWPLLPAHMCGKPATAQESLCIGKPRLYHEVTQTHRQAKDEQAIPVLPRKHTAADITSTRYHTDTSDGQVGPYTIYCDNVRVLTIHAITVPVNIVVRDQRKGHPALMRRHEFEEFIHLPDLRKHHRGTFRDAMLPRGARTPKDFVQVLTSTPLRPVNPAFSSSLANMISRSLQGCVKTGLSMECSADSDQLSQDHSSHDL